MNLDYSEEVFKTEARAVLGEYNKNSADPINKLIEVQRDNAYTTHTYKHTTMGFITDIQEMPNQYEHAKAFFERWYRPEYSTLIVAGDVEAEETLALVERYWGAWRPGSGQAVEIPQEPPQEAPVVAHVPWDTETLPWVSIGFHGPAFSTTGPDFAALDILFDLSFGETSDLYRRLVEQEQVVDQIFPYMPSNQDPGLATVLARVKRIEDAQMVRDAILETVAKARDEAIDAERLAEAKSNARFGFARTLDNSETIAATLARFVRFEREYGTVNDLFRVYDALEADDLQAAARKYLTEARMVVTTLSREELPEALRLAPQLPATGQPAARLELPGLVLQRSPAPLVRFKLLFQAGSAHEPVEREGLAQLSADMIAEAGSKRMRIDEINRALFPIAGSFGAQVDREMTTFTGAVHRDNLERFADIVLPQLQEPGYREEDFERLKARQKNALVQDLRASNDEELAKERLQANIFVGTPYGHPGLGTVAGIEAITLEETKAFAARAYSRANLMVGLAGDVPESFIERLTKAVGQLPEAERLAEPKVTGRRSGGLTVEIVAKETRATAISFGHPIDVTRSHPDFAALSVARAWLGEHRASNGRLFQRLREVRGLNYGDYAYIEAFPGGMYGFFPPSNIARRAQIFEVWIRPVTPEHGMFALKAGLHEVTQLLERGLSEAEFEATRNYLAKNVFVMTKTQDQQLGYALDSTWYGIPEYTAYLREQLAALDVGKVNDAIRRHLSATDLDVVVITKDADAFREELLADGVATIRYDAEKPRELLDEDRMIGARKLGVIADRVRVTPVDEVFAR